MTNQNQIQNNTGISLDSDQTRLDIQTIYSDLAVEIPIEEEEEEFFIGSDSIITNNDSNIIKNYQNKRLTSVLPNGVILQKNPDQSLQFSTALIRQTFGGFETKTIYEVSYRL